MIFHSRRGRSGRWFAVLAGGILAGGTALAGCADFSSTPPGYSAQPSLTPPVATPVVPDPPVPGRSTTPQSSGSSASPGSSAPADPCRPSDPAVVAACLDSPVGLQPLPDGTSAIVGERASGRILKVVYQQKPVVLTTITGVDAGTGGGLTAIALSPSYAEDGLIYAYVTTATDNRVYRIAAGDKPKAIFTGIPKGTKNNGGTLLFSGRQLFVGTGDAGLPAEEKSLAGKVLRLDEFGKPQGGTLSASSPVFATGLSAPTGMCRLPTGSVGVVDHRAAADLLLAVKPGKDYAKPVSGDAVWTWKAAEGGASDCAYTAGVLGNSSLTGKKASGVRMSAGGAFSGTPTPLVDDKYGRLRTIEPGPGEMFWLTTSNKDGQGKPVPADDRVIVIPANSGGGDGGND